MEEAVRRSGEKTYSATINRALQELVRRITVEEGVKLMGGSGWWQGDLTEMRRGREFASSGEVRDAPIRTKPRRRKSGRGSR